METADTREVLVEQTLERVRDHFVTNLVTLIELDKQRDCYIGTSHERLELHMRGLFDEAIDHVENARGEELCLVLTGRTEIKLGLNTKGITLFDQIRDTWKSNLIAYYACIYKQIEAYASGDQPAKQEYDDVLKQFTHYSELREMIYEIFSDNEKLKQDLVHIIWTPVETWVDRL